MLRILCLLIIATSSASSAVRAQGSERAWGAIALNGPVSGADAGVAGEVSFGRTRQAAGNSALVNCQALLKPGYSCRVVETFNKGCLYVSIGCNKESARCGYFIALNKAQAQAHCTREGLSCHVHGGCVSAARR
jgi:hypothetical protein